MAIPTSRTREKGTISIDTESCDGCGMCESVCKDFSLEIRDGKAAVSEKSVFGCIACGHCMAICPNDAITVRGRTLSPEDLFVIPGREEAAGYDQLLALYKRRRSIREFQNRPVEPELIAKILEAAGFSPMGIPPTDVNVLVLDSVEKARAFVRDFCEHLEKMKWFVSGWFLSLMKPFWGKENDELFRSFAKPLFRLFPESMSRGENYVTYDAPLTMYFYGSPYSDPADPIVAATAAMYAGESLGLGTCMLGAVHPLIQNGKSAARLRAKYGIRFRSREGVIVIFGYPAVQYRKGIKRSFASIGYYN
jgi:ferredoxin